MRRVVLAAAVLLGLFFAGGCTNDKKLQTADPSKDGGSLIYARGADSVGLDPINITDGESIRVTHAIFETLFEYDQHLQLQPKLAASYHTSEDGLTWTLELKEGIKFHDGTDFNADAVVFNFERWMDPENEYHIGDFPYYPFLYGGFKGDENHKIDHVKAVDPHTVEIKLNEKIAPFLSYLAIPMFGIASPAAIEQYNERFFENPVGTGPFVFDSWTRNDKIVVKANKNYYVKNEPQLSQLIFTVVPDNSARFNVLLSGEADIIDGMNPDDARNIEQDSRLQLVKRPSFNAGFAVFNTEKAPFDQVKVRQAVNYAVDKQSIVDGFFSGFAEAAKNPMPPALWGYNDKIKDYAYDPEQAKNLLAEAGYPNGFETEIWTMSNPRPYLPQPMKTAEAIQANLAEIGITAKIVTYEWATYLEKTGNGEHPIALYGWTGVMADPDNFLYPNLSSTNKKAPASNKAFYDNEQFQQLIEQARTTYDQEERAKLYEQAQEIFHEDAPWIPLAHTTPPIGIANYVKGFEAHPMELDNYAAVYIQK